jgi:hypothetical protein
MPSFDTSNLGRAMAVPGRLRRALHSGMISLTLAASSSVASAAGGSGPHITVALGPPSNARSEAAIVENGSSAPGRGANTGNDVSLPTPAEFKTIIQRTISAVHLQALVRGAARGTFPETDARVRELGAELDLREEALARIFQMLGRQDVPPEQLADLLAEIVARHKTLLERVRLLEASEPRAARLRDAVAAAIETADYELVDALLADAEAIEFEAVRQLLEALDQRVLKAAAIYAPSPAIAGTQLNYGTAAMPGALLHGGGRAGAEGARQFVPSDRFCQRHPEHRLCEQRADSSPLCDRLPDHPLCQDGDNSFCRRHPDHKRCELPPSPS